MHNPRCWLTACVITLASACTPIPPERQQLGKFDYATVTWADCGVGARPGPTGYSDDEALDSGLKFSVRTPNNYESTRQHPLIVVYAPAAHNRHRSEAFVHLTALATGSGFIIAYADSRRLSLPVIKDLAQVPKAVSEKWCIDEARIYLTGHSDGGTVANAIAFLPDMPIRARSIAPSAAGIRAQDMVDERCPQPLSVLTLQNDGDDLFPDYGRGLSAWWAECNQCSNKTSNAGANCRRYPDCENHTETMICENPGGHRSWPNRNHAIIDFFKRT